MRNNQSMIDELKISPEDTYIKKWGGSSVNLIGNEASLGHAYSLILESMHSQGIEHIPNPQGFIDNISENLKGRDLAYLTRRISLGTLTMVDQHLPSVIKYMHEHGFEPGAASKVVEGIIDFKLPKYSKKEIFRWM